MLRYFTFIVCLLASTAHGACEQFYLGGIKPTPAVSTLAPPMLLCRTDYEVLYSPAYKASFYAAEYLDPKAPDAVLRQNNFKPDYQVERGLRAEMADFLNSTYDKGHLAAAENHSKSKAAMTESFLLTNMVAQVPSHNRLIWRRLENDITLRVKAGEKAYVLTGPIFVQPIKTIGANKVAVPTALWKVAIWPEKQQVQAWIIPNVEVQPEDRPATFLTSLTTVQEQAQLTLFPHALLPWLK